MDNYINNFIRLVLTYDIQTLLTAIISFIISFSAFIIAKTKTSKFAKKVEQICKFLNVVFAVLLILNIIIQMTFSLVPNVYGYEPEHAKEAIHESKLEFIMDDFKYSEGKLVYKTTPEINAVVRKNTKVSLVFIDKNSEKIYTQLKPESNYNYHSNNINIDLLTPLNADNFELIFNDIGVYLHAENPEYSRELGQYAPNNIHVQLIDYETQQVIDEKSSGFSNSVSFKDIPKGTYIYRVECEGFEPLILTHPFKLEKDPNQEYAKLVWGINLKNNDRFFDTKFKVRILDVFGKPVIGKNFEISPIREDLDISSRSSISVETDKNGYISLWHSTTENGITTEYLDLVTFELNKEYNLYIIDEEGNYQIISEPINTNLYELVF